MMAHSHQYKAFSPTTDESNLNFVVIGTKENEKGQLAVSWLAIKDQVASMHQC